MVARSISAYEWITIRNELFALGLMVNCDIHGFHREWYKRRRSLKCRICMKATQKKYVLANPLKYLFVSAKSRTWLSCDIDEAYLKEVFVKQAGACALTGSVFSSECRPSLDRINSGLGYVRGNVQLVTIDINKMKLDFKQEQFIELCKAVAERNK